MTRASSFLIYIGGALVVAMDCTQVEATYTIADVTADPVVTFEIAAPGGGTRL